MSTGKHASSKYKIIIFLEADYEFSDVSSRTSNVSVVVKRAEQASFKITNDKPGFDQLSEKAICSPSHYWLYIII